MKEHQYFVDFLSVGCLLDFYCFISIILLNQAKEPIAAGDRHEHTCNILFIKMVSYLGHRTGRIFYNFASCSLVVVDSHLARHKSRNCGQDPCIV